MRKQTRRLGRPAAIPAAVLVLLPLGCCDGPIPPQTEGCMFDTSMVTECTVVVFDETGGIAGRTDRWVIRDDGTVKHVDLAGGAESELQVPGGAEQAAELQAALAASGLDDQETGCYEAGEVVDDGMQHRIVYQRQDDRRLFFFATEDGADVPLVIEDAIGLMRSYVAEAQAL
ncbi:MAG: hypothetical protein JXB32_15475 [Deltaproteobacteria bacterium]|nr:hypothetical protein [Deltaproteobacteria bacterium]